MYFLSLLLKHFDTGLIFLEICGVLLVTARSVGTRPYGRCDASFDTLTNALYLKKMRDVEVNDIGGRSDGSLKTRNIYHRISDGVVIVNTNVCIIKEVLLVGMTDEVVLGHFVLPVGAGNCNYLASALLSLLSGVTGCGIDTDVVEDNKKVALLEIVVLEN